ncbi:hypothetical protein ACQPZQ_02805 [Pseudonocardia sp. CA-142604]|uniref:hypothetical protein n=1 Tax=Pseudonocardia sp. CA-142604 TaxID=3240024 RepID=UPI003D94AE5D
MDIKLGVSAGSLVLLQRVEDRLEGHFTQRWAAFMGMRAATPVAAAPRAKRVAEARTRFTDIPATPWSANSAAWFLAHLQLPAGITFGFDLDPATRQPAASTLAARDGSWARRSCTDETVTEGGPTPLWRHVEWGYQQWMQAGQPQWERLGLTVTADGTHTLWVDDPAGPSWPVPSRPVG